MGRRTVCTSGEDSAIRSSIVCLDADVSGNRTRKTVTRQSLNGIPRRTERTTMVSPCCESRRNSVVSSFDDGTSAWDRKTHVDTQNQIVLKGSWEPALQPAICGDDSVEAPPPCGHPSLCSPPESKNSSKDAHSQISGADPAPSGEDTTGLLGYLVPAQLSSYHPPARDDDCGRSSPSGIPLDSNHLPKVWERLPEGWERAVAKDTGRVYYYNRGTNKRQWARPVLSSDRQLASERCSPAVAMAALHQSSSDCGLRTSAVSTELSTSAVSPEDHNGPGA